MRYIDAILCNKIYLISFTLVCLGVAPVLATPPTMTWYDETIDNTYRIYHLGNLVVSRIGKNDTDDIPLLVENVSAPAQFLLNEKHLLVQLRNVQTDYFYAIQRSDDTVVGPLTAKALLELLGQHGESGMISDRAQVAYLAWKTPKKFTQGTIEHVVWALIVLALVVTAVVCGMLLDLFCYFVRGLGGRRH